jgi:hypothetical protein
MKMILIFLKYFLEVEEDIAIMIMMIDMKQKWELHLEMQIQKEEDMLEEVVMQEIIYVEKKK